VHLGAKNPPFPFDDPGDLFPAPTKQSLLHPRHEPWLWQNEKGSVTCRAIPTFLGDLFEAPRSGHHIVRSPGGRGAQRRLPRADSACRAQRPQPGTRCEHRQQAAAGNHNHTSYRPFPAEDPCEETAFWLSRHAPSVHAECMPGRLPDRNGGETADGGQNGGVTPANGVDSRSQRPRPHCCSLLVLVSSADTTLRQRGRIACRKITTSPRPSHLFATRRNSAQGRAHSDIQRLDDIDPSLQPPSTPERTSCSR
jgi:hypothetical protein